MAIVKIETYKGKTTWRQEGADDDEIEKEEEKEN